MALAIVIDKSLIVTAIVFFILCIASSYKKLFPAFENSYKILFTFLPFYIVSGLSLWQTSSTHEGMFDLEVKFSLMLFPILFFFLNSKKINYKLIHTTFIIGCATYLLFCITCAGYHYISTDDNSHFFYASLTKFHPSYYAMYICFAFGAMWLLDIFKIFLKIALSVLMLLALVLLSSKSGILSIVLLLLFLLYHFVVGKNQKFTYCIVGLLLIFFGLMVTFKSSVSRINQALTAVTTHDSQPAKMESTSVRLALWKYCCMSIKSDFWKGVGAGDVNMIINKKLNDGGVHLPNQLNCHNQYFQVFCGLGLVGFISFMVPFIYFLFVYYQNGNTLSFVFILLIGFNFLFESMLETQAGVVFTAFFMSLFFHEYQQARR